MLSGVNAPNVQFDDPRLADLLFRLRARRDDSTLDAAERTRWWSLVKAKLIDGVGGGLTLAQYRSMLREVTAAPDVLAELREHADTIERRLRGESEA